MAEDFPQVDYAQWRARVEAELKGADFDHALKSENCEGLHIDPLHVAPAEPRPRWAPGQWPHRRGAGRSGADGVTWRLTQRQALTDLAELESAVLEDQAGGVRGFWLVLDRAARLGLDADDSASIEHLGVEGAPISELSQLDQVIGNLDFESARIHLDCGANALPAAGLLLAVLSLRDRDPAELDLRLNADPVSALARDGEIPGELCSLIREAAVLAGELSRSVPRARCFQVTGEPWHEAGASAAQELGILLSLALHYLRAMESEGMSLEAAAGQIAFRVTMGRDFFTNIAKLRALRQMWSMVLGHCGLDDAGAAEIHAVPARRTLSRYDMHVNMLRATNQSMAAVLGGAHELTTAAFDEALCAPWWPADMEDFATGAEAGMNSLERNLGRSSALARRVARNTQTILGEESHLGLVADAGGGSWFLESLTDQIIEDSWSLLQDIETEGGAVAALRQGFLHDLSDRQLRFRHNRLRRRRDLITGVSAWPRSADEAAAAPGKQRDCHLDDLRRHLKAHRQQRGDLKLKPLSSLEDAMEAALSCATLGEISRALEGRGEVEHMAPLRRRRDADDFEELRDLAHHLASGDRPPRVYIAPLGPPARHNARLSWIRQLMTCGGFDVVVGESDLADPATAMNQAGCDAFVLCGSDEDCRNGALQVLEPLVDELGGRVPLMIVGRPEKLGLELSKHVVPVHEGLDVVRLLGGLLFLVQNTQEGLES